MAAHDDKNISDNRRRLFKALSAAPVVMTLRPGEALANTSNVFQCAAKDMGTPSRFYYLESEVTAALCDSNNPQGCYVYEERTYWGPFTGLTSPCGVANGYIIVDIADGGGGTLYAVNTALGNDPNPDALPFNQWSASVSTDGTLTVTRTNNTGPIVCVTDPNPKTGLFLVVGGPLIVNSEPTNWLPTGVYPQFIPQSGNENLAGTCLDSFGATSSYILARG